jgi:basic membrane lipoprotein Med (substrate-binding protein (PBP1-ABC) superfamily)
VAESPECEAIDFLLVAGFEPTPAFSTVDANEDEAHYMGGVAASLLLDRSGGTTACMVGGPDLPFVRATEANLKAGMASHDPNKQFLVTLTGDFEDAALGTEALQALIDQGCQLFYSYLGGALPATWEFASQQGIPILSTSINTCGVPAEALPGGAEILASILYNPSLYLPKLIRDFAKGKFREGRQLAHFGVGDAKKLGIKDPNLGVGTVICEPTPEEQQTLDDLREGLASGDIEEIPEASA